MNENRAKSNQNLLKMKVALAAGGLVATLIGAGLLGNQAEATAVDTTTTTSTTANTTTTTINETESTSSTAITVPELNLDLNLEAIPTVAAPTSSTNTTNTFSNRPIANGRSSG